MFSSRQEGGETFAYFIECVGETLNTSKSEKSPLSFLHFQISGNKSFINIYVCLENLVFVFFFIWRNKQYSLRNTYKKLSKGFSRIT